MKRITRPQKQSQVAGGRAGAGCDQQQDTRTELPCPPSAEKPPRWKPTAGPVAEAGARPPPGSGLSRSLRRHSMYLAYPCRHRRLVRHGQQGETPPVSPHPPPAVHWRLVRHGEQGGLPPAVYWGSVSDEKRGANDGMGRHRRTLFRLIRGGSWYFFIFLA